MAYEAFFRAIGSGDLGKVEDHFQRNPLLVDAADPQGNTALHYVVREISVTQGEIYKALDLGTDTVKLEEKKANQLQIARLLIGKGADRFRKNMDQQTPYELALALQVPDEVTQLLDTNNPKEEVRILNTIDRRTAGGPEKDQPSRWRWLPLVLMALIGGAVALLTNFGVISINTQAITTLFNLLGVSLGKGALGAALAAAGVVLLPALVAYGLMVALDRWVVPKGWHLKTGLLAGRMSSVLGVAVVAALVLASAPVTWPVLLAIGVAVPLAGMFLGWGWSRARAPRGRGIQFVNTNANRGVQPTDGDRNDSLKGAGPDVGLVEPTSGPREGADTTGVPAADGGATGGQKPKEDALDGQPSDDAGDGFPEPVDAMPPTSGADAVVGLAPTEFDSQRLEAWMQRVTNGDMAAREAACFEAVRDAGLADVETIRLVEAFVHADGQLDVRDGERQESLLFAAVDAGKESTVHYLVEGLGKGNLDGRNTKERITALTAAAQGGNPRMVAQLLPGADPTFRFPDVSEVMTPWNQVRGEHADEITGMFVDNVRDRLDKASKLPTQDHTKPFLENVKRWCRSGAFKQIPEADRDRILVQAAQNGLHLMADAMVEYDRETISDDRMLALLQEAWKNKYTYLAGSLLHHCKAKMNNRDFVLRLFNEAVGLGNEELTKKFIDEYISKADIRGSFIDADWLQRSGLSPVNQLKLAVLLLDPKLVETIMHDNGLVRSKRGAAIIYLSKAQEYKGLSADDEDACNSIAWLFEDEKNRLTDWPAERERQRVFNIKWHVVEPACQTAIQEDDVKTVYRFVNDREAYKRHPNVVGSTDFSKLHKGLLHDAVEKGNQTQTDANDEIVRKLATQEDMRAFKRDGRTAAEVASDHLREIIESATASADAGAAAPKVPEGSDMPSQLGILSTPTRKESRRGRGVRFDVSAEGSDKGADKGAGTHLPPT